MGLPLLFRLAVKLRHPAERLHVPPEEVARSLREYAATIGVGLECDCGGCSFVVDPGDDPGIVSRRVAEAGTRGDVASWSYAPPGWAGEGSRRTAHGLRPLEYSRGVGPAAGAHGGGAPDDQVERDLGKWDLLGELLVEVANGGQGMVVIPVKGDDGRRVDVIRQDAVVGWIKQKRALVELRLARARGSARAEPEGSLP